MYNHYMTEGPPISKAEKVGRICTEFGIEVVNNCADLTHLSAAEAMNLFDRFLQSGEIVLHGTNSSEVYDCLETRQGHCVIKESGRKVAVYATNSPKTALSVAVLNRSYLKSKLTSYIFGYSGDDSKLIFKAPPEMYQLFLAHDPNLFADGYVYVLDKDNFINAPDAGDEWHSESNQEPILACKVSKDTAADIYITGTDNDTVVEHDWESEK
jgi:hypothetical protein